MDWAIRAAKRKTKRAQGSSRSIVESLNKFNDVLTRGNDRLNQLYNKKSEWLDDEMRRVGFKIEERSIASPDVSIFHDDEVDQKASGGTPKRINRSVTHTTPRSLPEDEIKDIEVKHEESQRHEPATTPSSNKYFDQMNKMDAVKSSPWSPYKVDRTLKAAVLNNNNNNNNNSITGNNTTVTTVLDGKDQLQDSIKRDSSERSMYGTNTSTPNTKTKISPRIAPGLYTVKGDQIGVTDIKQEDAVTISNRDRSQRRSNMFIPLPNKDPLIVQPVTSKLKQSKPSVVPERKLVSAKISNYSFTSHASTASPERRGSVSPTRDILKRDHTTKSNVFDRLSSLPTKSFEKKVLRKSLAYDQAKYHTASNQSIAVTGSPIRRKSPTTTKNLTPQVAEPLKGALDSHIPKLTSGKPRLLSLSSTGFSQTTKRKSLIPRFDRRTTASPKSEIHSVLPEKRNRSPSPSRTTHANGVKEEKTPRTRDKMLISKTPKLNRPNRNLSTPKLNGNPNNSKAPARPNFIANEKVSTLSEQKTPSNTTKKLVTVNAKQTQGEEDEKREQEGEEEGEEEQEEEEEEEEGEGEGEEREEQNGANPGTKKKFKTSHDRLTKFQLLPQGGSEKYDLKKKLDKRLSEVMRTQQENQQRRKQEQQKRKSQLEEDTKRRTKLLYEPSDSLKNSKPPSTANPYLQKLPGNSVLYDLNTVDHMEKVGGSNYEEENFTADQTLPDIDSDSESEDNKILAPWAQSPYLQEQLLLQQHWDPEKIFGPIPPLHVDEIFQNSRLSRLKSRQSLARISVGSTLEPKRNQ